MINFGKIGFLIAFLSFLAILAFLGIKSFKLSKPASTPPLAPKSHSTPQGEKIKYPQDFTIVLVGDSMTEGLGNSDELRKYLKDYYPDKSFEVLNYGFGSTNILSIPERLEKTTFYTRDFRPITDIDFDLIIIESMGHNPLSHLPLEEGLKKQAEALDKIVSILKTKNPNAKIVFLVTIAPSKVLYGTGTVELSKEKRLEWANERIAYIKNHIEYSSKNNIPLINVYKRSLKAPPKDELSGSAYEKSLIEGDLNIDLVNDKDYIHLSPTGIVFVSKIIAEEINNQKLLE